MDANKLPWAKRFLGIGTLALAFAVRAQAWTTEHDSFETPKFASFWNSARATTIPNSPGANSTRGFARLNSATEKLEGNLPIANSNGLSDFSIEFFFRSQNENGKFALEIDGAGVSGSSSPAPVFTLSWNAQKGWMAREGQQNESAQPVKGLKTISPNAWYRFRFRGFDWGTTNAHFEAQLSDAAGEAFTSSTASISCSSAPPALRFALHNTSASHSTFDVDEVDVAATIPYKGVTVSGVNAKTLTGKVMCGYQGWFGTPTDGRSEPDWRHWTKEFGRPLEDGNAKIDFWPDVSELGPGERFPTGFKLANGKPAEVFSSFQRPTVLKHFEWMQEYGIDGVFVQRFANGLKHPASLEHCNTVLANCREGANLRGRTYAVMYDLSGLPAGRIADVMNDWRALRNEMLITDDPAYLNHRGKPVVAVWGIGFDDGRQYTLAECRQLIEFLKNDPEVGGCTVMLGVPASWRELKNDAVNDPELLKIIGMADIVSPWTVGRYANVPDAAHYAETLLKPDLAWCNEHGIDFLPVVFPGFSWHNMKEDGPSNQIPRLHGQFLWSQFCNAKQANVSMIYVAMFDEVDEGTAIFKCANDVPVGEKSKFVTLEGLPSDFYLKMVGAGTKLLRGDTASKTTSSFSAQN